MDSEGVALLTLFALAEYRGLAFQLSRIARPRGSGQNGSHISPAIRHGHPVNLLGAL